MGLLVVLCTLSGARATDRLIHVRLDTADAQAVASTLIAEGFDVLEGSIDAGSLELIVSAADLSLLESLGHKPVTLAESRPFREIQRERWANLDDAPPGYPDLAEVVAEMNAAAVAFPSICRFVDLTTTYDVPPTFEGRHLYAVKISDNVQQEEDEPAFLLVSCRHAREMVTPVIALHAIEQFTTQYGNDPQITALVDTHEIWIAPVWNPDGYVYVFEVNNMWRKNRRVFPTGVGVDLNHNVPFVWESVCSGSTVVTNLKYKGPCAVSEPETMTTLAFTEDQHFAKVLDYHSYGRETLWEYHCHGHPFDAWLESEAIALSEASGYNGAHRPPSADAEDYQWHLSLGAFANLVETATVFQPSYASAQAEAQLVFPGVLWMLERPIPVSGHVTDAVTGAPVEAALRYLGIDFANGETNHSRGPFGLYHAFLPPGQYQIEFSAPGYTPQTHAVSIAPGSSQVLDVQLVPPPLWMRLLVGPVVVAPPGTAPPLKVEIRPGLENVVAGSERLFYRYDAGSFVSVALSAAGGNFYCASLPTLDCDDTPEFYFAAEGDAGTSVFLPSSAPAEVFSFAVGELLVLVNDDFEDPAGWTVRSHDLTTGAWTREDPIPYHRFQEPAGDYDGSGKCWVTGNTPEEDVDGGPTILTSSVFDLAGTDEPEVSYARWVATNDPDHDRLIVQISNGDGATWVTVEDFADDGGWEVHTFRVTDFVTPTKTMRLRFSIQDNPNDSITEAAIDALRIVTVECTAMFPLGDLNCDGAVNVYDIDPFVLAISDPAAYGAAWPDCNVMLADCNGDGHVDAFDVDPFVELLAGG